MGSHHLLLGDVNYLVDNPCDFLTTDLVEGLSTLYFKLCNHLPTCEQVHILDVIFAKNVSPICDTPVPLPW